MKGNIIEITGIVEEEPKQYDLYRQNNIYSINIDVKRDSGVTDSILVLFREQIFNRENKEEGEIAVLIKENRRIKVNGTIQTHKNKQTGRTQLFVWANYIEAMQDGGREINMVCIVGKVAKTPINRTTPRGRNITEISLSVPSIFKEGYYSYIPCIAWDKRAEIAQGMPEGVNVYAEGRIQSREYIKSTENGKEKIMTWEVSISKIAEQDLGQEAL